MGVTWQKKTCWKTSNWKNKFFRPTFYLTDAEGAKVINELRKDALKEIIKRLTN